MHFSVIWTLQGWEKDFLADEKLEEQINLM